MVELLNGGADQGRKQLGRRILLHAQAPLSVNAG